MQKAGKYFYRENKTTEQQSTLFCTWSLEHRGACHCVTPSLQRSANPEEKYSPAFKS